MFKFFFFGGMISEWITLVRAIDPLAEIIAFCQPWTRGAGTIM